MGTVNATAAKPAIEGSGKKKNYFVYKEPVQLKSVRYIRLHKGRHYLINETTGPKGTYYSPIGEVVKKGQFDLDTLTLPYAQHVACVKRIFQMPEPDSGVSFAVIDQNSRYLVTDSEGHSCQSQLEAQYNASKEELRIQVHYALGAYYVRLSYEAEKKLIEELNPHLFGKNDKKQA